MNDFKLINDSLAVIQSGQKLIGDLMIMICILLGMLIVVFVAWSIQYHLFKRILEINSTYICTLIKILKEVNKSE